MTFSEVSELEYLTVVVWGALVLPAEKYPALSPFQPAKPSADTCVLCVQVNGSRRVPHICYGEPSGLESCCMSWVLGDLFYHISGLEVFFQKNWPWSAGQLLQGTEQFSACAKFGGSKFHGSFVVLGECRISKVLWTFLVATSDASGRPEYNQASALCILTGLKIKPIRVTGVS